MTGSTGPGKGPPPPRRSWAKLPVAGWALLAVVVASGLYAWGVGVVHRGYDYDEVQRAHSVWLASLGLRPYVDMFEVHPPYFALLTPILGSRPDPCDGILALRIFASAGNLAFLAGLVALGWDVAGRDRRWAGLGVSSVAFHPKVLDYLVEYRIDGWGYAIAAWGLVLFLRRPGWRWRFATFGALSGLATLFCPKLAILPPLVVGFELVRGGRSWREASRRGLEYASGLGIAGMIFAAYLAASGIPLDRTYQLLFRYHTLSNAHSSYHRGLLRQVVATPALVGPIALGMVAWGVGALRKRAIDGAYPPALALWLVVQAWLVSYHYKQYYAPWFLFGSAFVALLGRSLDDLWRPLGVAAYLAACGATIVSALGIAQLWERYSMSRIDCATIRAMNVLAGPDDRVVAPPPHHPIGRRDAFFLWFNTSDPNGYDSERILEGLPAYGAVVSPGRNAESLREFPPAFVVLDEGPVAAPYPAGQWRALLDFLPRRGYRAVRMRGLRLALRPDRHDALRGRGLFEDDAGPLGPVMPRGR